jgi:hypothetical protein
MPVNGVLSTPGTDFSLALGRDLREIGATEAEALASVLGVQQGGVLVFAQVRTCKWILLPRP